MDNAGEMQKGSFLLTWEGSPWLKEQDFQSGCGRPIEATPAPPAEAHSEPGLGTAHPQGPYSHPERPMILGSRGAWSHAATESSARVPALFTTYSPQTLKTTNF